MVLFDGMTATTELSTTTSTTTPTAAGTTTATVTATKSNGSSSLTKESYSIFLQTLGSVHALLVLAKPYSEIEDPFLRHLWNIGIVKLPEIEQAYRLQFS